MSSARRRLDLLKQRVTALLRLLDDNGRPIPVIESVGPAKAFRSRGAGSAQDKKRERRGDEQRLLQQRVRQLEAEARLHGLLDRKSVV